MKTAKSHPPSDHSTPPTGGEPDPAPVLRELSPTRLLGAIQFLTIIPVRGKTAPPGLCAAWFPLIGAALGALAGIIYIGTAQILPRPIAALLSIAFLMTATGCLHEDGLADVADAIRAHRSREKILAILKDSRIGTFGAAALIISLLIRWQSLEACRLNPIAGLAAALALSRASLVALAFITPATGDGLGQFFAYEITRPSARPLLWITLIQSIALAFLAGWIHALAMLLATTAILILARSWFRHRLSGITGDCLGATCQVVETVNLILLTWQPFI